jgi:anti-sigma factor RsiW
MSPPTGIGCESLEAYIDSELSAAESAVFDTHMAGCLSCQKQAADYLRLRTQLRASLSGPQASDDLKRRILASLPARAPVAAPRAKPRQSWMQMAMAASVAAILASTGTIYVTRQPAEVSWQQAIVNAHLRATLSGHTIDVASSDRHTVKPWFGGKTKIAPTVRDLADAGYPLIGGRLDIPQQEALPVLVYKIGQHVVSVFVHPADQASQSAPAQLDGFTVLTWSDGDLAYSAVSDADSTELHTFQQAFIAAYKAPP